MAEARGALETGIRIVESSRPRPEPRLRSLASTPPFRRMGRMAERPEKARAARGAIPYALIALVFGPAVLVLSLVVPLARTWFALPIRRPLLLSRWPSAW